MISQKKDDTIQAFSRYNKRPMEKIKTAVIGTGYLGKYHVEKLATLPQSQLIAICDIDAEHSHALSEKYQVRATTDYHSLIGQVEAVSIVTPTPSHFEIGHFFLERGVHVLIEKPISTTVEEADQLIQMAKKNNVVLQVGHLERFNSALKSVLPLISQPKFIESHRIAPFKLRGSDVPVILDLMIHDIDIILSIVKSTITDIRASGASVLTPFIDIANARIEFDNGCVASITASRVNVISDRRLRIFQHDCYISLDLDRKKYRVHRKSHQDMFPGIPAIQCEKKHLEKGDALREEIESFLTTIINKTEPVVTGFDGRNALATALQITQLTST